MHRNYANLENGDSASKDILISTMKKQLYELKKLGHEHLTLIDDVKNIESKYNLLNDENARIENQYKTKSELNRKIIENLRNQIDTLKLQIHKCSVQIDDTMRTNSNLNRVKQNKQHEIEDFMAINQDLQKNIGDQVEINNNLNQQIKQIKDDRNSYENQCERLKRSLEEAIATLKTFEKQARTLDTNNNKLNSIISIAQKDQTGLVDDIKSRETKVEMINARLGKLQQQKQQLRDKTIKIEKQCVKSETDYKSVCNELETTINRNKQLNKKLISQENMQRNIENQLQKAKLERQLLNKNHMNLQMQNQQLNTDIDQCMISIIEYEKINQELQREIQYFIECDEEARSMLNRRQAMRNLLELVTNRLHQTSEQIVHLR